VVSGDSLIYMRLGYSLATEGRYYIPHSDPWNQTVRTPGYPGFLALLFAYFGGMHLTVTLVVQAFLHMIAIGALAWSLRRSIPPTAMRLGILVGALDPVGYFMSRALLSDGLSTDLVLLAIAAYLESLRVSARARTLARAGFGCATACAGLVRPTAVVVLILPLLEVAHALLPRGRREASYPSAWRGACATLALCVIPLAVAFSGWALFNKLHFNYLGISSYAPTVRFAALMETGTFDVRALKHPDLYAAYLRGREAANYWQYHVQMTGPISTYSRSGGKSYVRRLNQAITEIADASEHLTPLPLRVARHIRSLWWASAFPDVRDYGGFPQRDWNVQFDYGFNVVSQKRKATQLEEQMPGVVLDSRAISMPIWAYSLVARHYDSVASLLFPIGALSAVVALYLDRPAAACLFIVYSANVLVHAWIGLVFGRYIQCYGFLLILQTILGVRLLWRRGRRPSLRPR
jgi:hypothetical protein